LFVKARAIDMFICASLDCPYLYLSKCISLNVMCRLIYVLDPASLMTVAARREAATLPTKTRSDITVSNTRHTDDTPPLTDDNDTDEDEERRDETRLTMSPTELRVIRRLAERANVLPVIGHADSLTDSRLHAAKEAIRRELAQAGLDFSVFGPAARPKPPPVERNISTESDSVHSGVAGEMEQGNGSSSVTTTNGNGNTEEHESAVAEDDVNESVEVDEREDRRARPVIKLRTGRRHSSARARSRSRSRMDLASEARDDREPTLPDSADIDNVANARFSAATLARADLSRFLPFALIAPEHTRRHRSAKPTPWDEVQADDSIAGSTAGEHESPVVSPVAGSVRGMSFAGNQPEDLRGVFTRAYRWGTIDVLEPAHCDYAALRTAILSTHMKVLYPFSAFLLEQMY
jgi:hypothetical protein